MIRDIYYLSILPITIVAVLIINGFILRNTPEEELCSLTAEEYSERAKAKCYEVFYKPYMYLLDFLATISWILIISKILF